MNIKEMSADEDEDFFRGPLKIRTGTFEEIAILEKTSGYLNWTVEKIIKDYNNDYRYCNSCGNTGTKYLVGIRTSINRQWYGACSIECQEIIILKYI